MAEENKMRSVNYFITDSSVLKNLKLENFRKIAMPVGIFEVEDPVKPSYAEFEVDLPFYFNELICSVSAKISEDDLIEPSIEIDGEIFSCGKFSVGNSESYLKTSEKALMDTDILKLQSKRNKIKVKINLYNNSKSANIVRLINLVFTDNTLPYSERKDKVIFNPILLPVPQISQMMQQVNYSQDICSPTSLAMVMAYYGINESPVDIAQKLVDNSSRIYGNWLFNTAYASYKGLYSFVARINTVEEAYEYLLRGIPLIASITFGPGELKNSPIKKSKGHLVVIKGFDKNGNFIVNDPAAINDKQVEITYDKNEFSNAWLKNKFGTSYVIIKDIYKFLSPVFPYSELFTISTDTKKQIETQILPDEKISFVNKKENIMVELLEQTTTDRNNRVINYKGYIDKFTFALPTKYEAIVVNKNSVLYNLDFVKTDKIISMGSKICSIQVVEKDNNKFIVGISGDKFLILNYRDIAFFNSQKVSREEIIRRAKQFLGDTYYLGGRSSFGVDCSGLVNLVYRTFGINIPRNAKDQYFKAQKIEKKDLKPGDLIFSTEINSSFISHVMMYSGNGNIIESTRDSNSVREVSFKEKFGMDFSQVRSGISVKGRKIYFGRFIDDRTLHEAVVRKVKDIKKSKN